MSRLPESASFSSPPPNGSPVEIEPGLLWLRLALPFRLNHVNVYLVEDESGWLLVDTGPGDAATVEVWSRLLDDRGGPLNGKPITRVVATHFHPDHVGAAGFICARTGAPLLMSEVEYLTALTLVAGDAAEAIDLRLDGYRRHGTPAAQIEAARNHVARYRALVPSIPSRYVPLRAGDSLDVGRRRLSVLLGAGHAPAQVILHETASNLLLVADQVMTRISPNVGILDRSPDDNPLRLFLESLAALCRTVPDGGLILPGHHLPFRTLHARIDELTAHHGHRCVAIESAIAARGLTAGELVGVLFPFQLDSHQFWFAFSEVLAHLNFMQHDRRVEPRMSHGYIRWGRLGRTSHSG